MINIRYHIISLTAVFLALGIGVIIGSTLLEQTFSTALSDQVKTLEGRVRERSEEAKRLSGGLERAQREDDAYVDGLLDRVPLADLEGQPVVVVAVRGQDEGMITAGVRALIAGGAEVPLTVWLDDRLDPADPEAMEATAEALADYDGVGLGPTTTSPSASTSSPSASTTAPGPTAPGATGSSTTVPGRGDTPALLWAALAADLSGADSPSPGRSSSTTAPPRGPGVTGTGTTSGRAGPTTTAPSRTSSALVLLADAGRLDTVPQLSGSSAAGIPPDAQILVFWGEGSDLDTTSALTPLLENLAQDAPGRTILSEGWFRRSRLEESHAVEPLARGRYVDVVRKNPALRSTVSSIDGVDRPVGVAGLELLVAYVRDGEVGHYGTTPGADSVLPPITE